MVLVGTQSEPQEPTRIEDSSSEKHTFMHSIILASGISKIVGWVFYFCCFVVFSGTTNIHNNGAQNIGKSYINGLGLTYFEGYNS
jgi:hypothetical protein